MYSSSVITNSNLVLYTNELDFEFEGTISGGIQTFTHVRASHKGV